MPDDTTNPPLKRCSKCGEWKPATKQYFPWRSQRNKLNTHCRACVATANRERRARSPQHVLKMAEAAKHEGEKRCSKCGEWKPATTDYFNKNERGEYGLRSQCRVCTNASWHKNKTKYIPRMLTYRTEKRDKIKADAAAYREKHKRKNSLPGSWRPVADNTATLRHCKRCARDFPATSNYFRRDSTRRDGLYPYCKECQSAANAAWRAAAPGKHMITNQRREARKLGLPATFTYADWERCLEYWSHSCAICGRPRGLWHTLSQDHWIPVCKGGGYTPDNILPLCHGEGGCNNRKREKHAHDWLLLTFGKRKAAQIERRIQEYFNWVKARSGTA